MEGGPVETYPESVPETSQPPELVIGLLASPGPASELAESLAGEIAERLDGQLPGVRWRVEFVCDRLVEPPTDLSALISAARRMLLERGWHLAVCVTDLPLQTARRPVIAHASATHGVAVLSMPALGPVAVRKRAVDTIVRLVGQILGDLGPADSADAAGPVTRRIRELGRRTERDEHGARFLARVITGNIWLLLGMLRANRPWRLALQLMRVLAVAFAAGVFALVTSDIWRLAHYLGPLRLTVIALGSVAAITVTIMVSTGLWERSPHPGAREQVALFNIVTAATVGLGVAALYLALFIAMLAAALLLVPGNLLSLVLAHPDGAADQVSLAWLGTSIATLGGALGAALETSETVREAAYTYQPDTGDLPACGRPATSHEGIGTVQIGTGLPNQVRNVRPDVIPAWAARAEKAGFSTLGTVGRYAYPGVSDTVALAAAAGATTTIGLMTGVALAPTWPGPLLAKELAGIDGVSGGRLTAGIGVGIRPDDFVADGYGTSGRGARLDRDLETFRAIWQGEPVGGGPNPAVPGGTRQIPLLFGGMAAAAMDRMARWGEGYIGGSVPAPMVAPAFDAARDAWQRAGRDGSPRLVALVYYALGDSDAGKRNVYDYYSVSDELAKIVAGAVCDSAAAVRAAVSSFADIGTDEVIFNTGTDDPDDIERLAEIVL